MLVLSRQRDETIMIGDEVEVTVVDIRGDKVRLGITAPRQIQVHRKEVYEAIKRENRAAAQVRPEDMAPPTGQGAKVVDPTKPALRPTVRARLQSPQRPARPGKDEPTQRQGPVSGGSSGGSSTQAPEPPTSPPPIPPPTSQERGGAPKGDGDKS